MFVGGLVSSNRRKIRRGGMLGSVFLRPRTFRNVPGDRWRFVDRRGDARSRNTARRDARAAYPAAPAIRPGVNYFGRRKLRGIVCPRNLHVLISILRGTVNARSLNLFASSMNLLGKGSFTVACRVHSFFAGRRIARRGIHARKRVG